MEEKSRCSWSVGKSLYETYHDEEWGIPTYDERMLFEMLCLEGAQAGLSWWTILQKRPHYQKVFDQFDPEKIASYDEQKIAALLNDPGIVRNKLKVNGFIKNARAFLKLKNEGKDFSQYIWDFVDGTPIMNEFKESSEVPATTSISDVMSKTLKKAGFTFVGSTIVYAYMQSCGLVNDHLQSCWCYQRDRA